MFVWNKFPYYKINPNYFTLPYDCYEKKNYFRLKTTQRKEKSRTEKNFSLEGCDVPVTTRYL